MSTISTIFLLVIINFVSAPNPSASKKYRTDYVYNKRTDAFYKFHIEYLSRNDAGRVCEMEGAGLMLPNRHDDIVQLHSMFKRFPDLGNYVWIAEDGQAHESAEEPAIINLEPVTEEVQSIFRQCDVMTRQGEIETFHCSHPLPFICKVDAKAAPYNERCDVYGTDYKIFENVRSCYKIPRVPYSWDQAYAECKAEGAHLVVLNSPAEHDEVYRLMNDEPKVLGSQAWWFFFAGYRAIPTMDGSPKVFKTIFNETLEEAGYSVWAENEPNNAANNEDCGTLFKKDGKLNDVYCSHLYGFICEKELPTNT